MSERESFVGASVYTTLHIESEPKGVWFRAQSFHTCAPVLLKRRQVERLIRELVCWRGTRHFRKAAREKFLSGREKK